MSSLGGTPAAKLNVPRVFAELEFRKKVLKNTLNKFYFKIHYCNF